MKDKLDARETAHFDSSKVCLTGTRIDLLGDVGGWLDKLPADLRAQYENMLWLHGKAGSGKSAVAHTAAMMAQERGFPLATFFCKTDDPYLQNPRKVLPALAYRIAEQVDEYRVALLRAVRSSADGAGIAHTLPVSSQLALLFGEGILSSAIRNYGKTLAFIIDALDELTSSDELVQSLAALSSMVPEIKIFMTRRDDPSTKDAIEKCTGSLCVDINEVRHVDEDIDRYIRSRTASEKLNFGEATIRALVRQSQGLFIWCTTLFSFLIQLKDDGLDPSDFVTAILEGGEHLEAFGSLYALYDQVLNASTTTSAGRRAPPGGRPPG